MRRSSFGLIALLCGCFVKPDDPNAIAWVKAFVGKSFSGTDGTFSAQAAGTGDAIVLHVFCGSAARPSIDITSSWTWTKLRPVGGAASQWAASFGAIAPDTATTQFNVSTGADCGSAMLVELGDEYERRPDGGTTTFDGADLATGSGGPCVDVVTTHNAGDAVWGACTSGGSTESIGNGFAQGATDGNSNYSEYKITSDPANTPETVTFPNTNTFTITTVSIKRAKVTAGP